MQGRRTLQAISPNYRSQEKGFENVESVVKHYEQIIDRLKRLVTDGKLKSYHSMDAVRFHKLVEWVAFKEHNLRMVEEAWSSSYFWPFLETMEAVRLVQNDPSQLVIRLSNTHSGTITITRYGKVSQGVGDQRTFEAQVKHKRCVVNHDGMLLLMNEDNNQEVSWQELVNHLLTRECCICLEEIVSSTNGVTLPCKHCFHKTCLRGYLSYTKRQGREDQCISCRLLFRKMQWPEIINSKSLSTTTPMATSKRLSNIPIITELSSTIPHNDVDEQFHNENESDQESTAQNEMKLRSRDNSQTALHSTAQCSAPTSTQALQEFESNCNQSRSLRVKSWPSSQSSSNATYSQKPETIISILNAESKENPPRNTNYDKINVNHKNSMTTIVEGTTSNASEKKTLFQRLGLRYHK